MRLRLGLIALTGCFAIGLSASGALVVHLRPKREKAVPFLVAGAGFYRASFDMGNGRFDGAMNMGRSRMDGRRLAEDDRGRESLSGRRSFTDPAISLGGGIRIDVGSRLYLRPDARALIVTSGGDADTVGVFTVDLGYRF